MSNYPIANNFQARPQGLSCAIVVTLSLHLSGCQQVLDRLVADLKESSHASMPTDLPSVTTTPQVSTKTSDADPKASIPESVKTPPMNTSKAPSPKERPQKTPVTTKEKPPAPSPSPGVSRNGSGANKIQTVDEDGNPLDESPNSKKSKPARVLIDD